MFHCSPCQVEAQQPKGVRREAVTSLLDDKWLSGLARRGATDFGTLTGMASMAVVSNSLTN